MFGFSLQKLLFTILIIAIVWYGFKMLARLQERRDSEKTLRRAPSNRGRDKDKPADAEDMVACATCGAFVPARRARSCGRDDCPYPG